MRSLFLLPALLSTLAAAAPQDPAPAPAAGIVAGRAPGTVRYIARFASRDFDLEELRAAFLARRPPAAVDAIIADLAARAAAHHAELAAAVERLGGRMTHDFWLVDACAFEIAPAAVAELREVANVLDIEPDHVTEPAILRSTDARNHNTDAVQARGVKGRGATAAIMDTGLDANMAGSGRPHATFYRNGDPSNPTGPGIGGSRLLANVMLGTEPADNTHPHGTGVAGIALGAKWFNNASYDDGHAPEADIVGYSIANNSAGSSSQAVMAGAWQRMVQDKAVYDLVAANNSYTGFSCDVTEIINQSLDAAAYAADIVCVVAAGNGGSNNQFSQPASNGLAVGAVSFDNHQMASFSSFGPLVCDANRFWPDIAACGVGVTMPRIDSEPASYGGSGTSMASPQVCGTATLVRSVNPGLNAQETKAILLATAEDIAANNPGRTRQNYGMGFLRSDLAVALAERQGSAFTRRMPAIGVTHAYRIAVTPNVEQTVVLCWPRRLGRTTSSQWSNLRLRVVDGPTVLGTSDDTNQLYERVRFTTAASTVTVEVSASSLEGGLPIDYSVAHTGSDPRYVPGGFALFGSGCAGSSGPPTIGALGVPTLGQLFRITLTGARPNAPVALLLGASDSSWMGVGLPWAIPGAPGCFVNVSREAFLSGTSSDAAGEHLAHLRVPASTDLLGAVLFAQHLVADPVNAAGIVTTRGARAVIGGQP